MSLVDLKGKQQKSVEFPDMKGKVCAREVEMSVGSKAYKFLRIEPTWQYQAMRVLEAIVKAIGILALLCVALYLPDYVLDYSNRGDAFDLFFINYLAILSGVIIFVVIMYVILHPHVVYIDRQNRRVIFTNLGILNERKLTENGIEFAEVESVELMTAGSFVQTSKVALLARSEYFVVAEGRGESKEYEALRDWFNAIIFNEKQRH